MSSSPDFAVIAVLHESFSRILAEHYPSARSELWLNPADRDALGVAPGATLFGLPVHASIGIPAGTVAVFDRSAWRYLRDPGPA